MEDLILAHIVGMDTYARGLRAAAKMKEERFFEEIMEEKYASFTQGIGKKLLMTKKPLNRLVSTHFPFQM